MKTSYTRNCKVCGRKINMRQMPGGQWVAFEGYDQIHDHKKPITRTEYVGADKNKSSYSDLDFDNIDLGSYEPRINQDVTKGGEVQPSYSRDSAGKSNYKSSSKPSSSDSGVWGCVFYAILAFVVLKACLGS